MEISLNDISKKFCVNPKCNGIMKEVLNLAEVPWTRTCWYCDVCGKHDPAIGRERVVNSYHQIKGRA
jgi:hypothetical protein